MRAIYQMQFPNFDPLIKLQVAREVLSKFMDPVPHPKTMVAWLEEGRYGLEGKQLGPGRYWYVYQSSLQLFIDEHVAPRQQKLAA